MVTKQTRHAQVQVTCAVVPLQQREGRWPLLNCSWRSSVRLHNFRSPKLTHHTGGGAALVSLRGRRHCHLLRGQRAINGSRLINVDLSHLALSKVEVCKGAVHWKNSPEPDSCETTFVQIHPGTNGLRRWETMCIISSKTFSTFRRSDSCRHTWHCMWETWPDVAFLLSAAGSNWEFHKRVVWEITLSACVHACRAPQSDVTGVIWAELKQR